MNALSIGGHEVALALPVAVLLTAIALLAMARLLYLQWRATPTQRSRGWRVVLLVLAQPVCAALLYLALFPPAVTGTAGTLVVATSGATTQLLRTGEPGEAMVALPEAPTLPNAERVPDLATALRRHPDVSRLRVVGTGLEARDRDAARGLELEFLPAPLPRGLVELAVPSHVAAGNEFRADGRVEGLSGGAAELLDPGRQRIDRAALDADGRFALTATTRVASVATYVLRLRDAEGQLVEDVELPLQIEDPVTPRVLMLAGAPNPEVKYLRRWVRDAGLALHTQIAAGGGMELGDGPLSLDVVDLSRFDVVVLDERAWSAMGDARRTALGEAVRGGLGVLLRVTAVLSDAEQRRLRALGFQVDAGRESAPVRLGARKRDDDDERARLGPGTRDAPRAPDATVAEVPVLTRRALHLAGDDVLPLLRDDTGVPVAVWRASGRGRVALWTPTDTYRLALAGRGDLHGELWSRALATIARARPSQNLELPVATWQGERATLCGLDDEATVLSPGGVETVLLRDPAAGANACAGFWPDEAGWHRVHSGEREQLFHVRARDAAPSLRAAALRESTLQIAAESRGAAATAESASPIHHPGPRWPWWLAWLLTSAALWWLERSRVGRAPAPGSIAA